MESPQPSTSQNQLSLKVLQVCLCCVVGVHSTLRGDGRPRLARPKRTGTLGANTLRELSGVNIPTISRKPPSTTAHRSDIQDHPSVFLHISQNGERTRRAR
jgi:hypothetical protein